MDADRPLVDAAAAGDREAFDELVRRHQTRILSLTRALLAGSAEADDIAQEVFVRAWRGIRGFRGDGTFSAWLHRIAANLICSQQRRFSRERRLFGMRVGEEASDAVEGLPSPADVETEVMLRVTIDRALARLPFDLRIAVVLRDLQGLDYKEIASALDIPIGTVESRIFRGRQRLRPLLRLLQNRATGASGTER